jgi:p-cumate 2,3-dioxygenase subunit beta
MSTVELTRAAAEDFVYHEAELLDDWRLPEWAALFTSDGTYEITSMNLDDPVNASASDSLFIIADDRARLESRARRLMKKTAHAEYPHSKTRHLVSNVRIGPGETSSEYRMKTNFAVYRTKNNQTGIYMGEARYLLVMRDKLWKIKSKRCILDLDTLTDQGRLTIII